MAEWFTKINRTLRMDITGVCRTIRCGHQASLAWSVMWMGLCVSLVAYQVTPTAILVGSHSVNELRESDGRSNEASSEVEELVDANQLVPRLRQRHLGFRLAASPLPFYVQLKNELPIAALQRPRFLRFARTPLAPIPPPAR